MPFNEAIQIKMQGTKIKDLLRSAYNELLKRGKAKSPNENNNQNNRLKVEVSIKSLIVIEQNNHKNSTFITRIDSLIDPNSFYIIYVP